ncbi:MAG TPA: alpha/beta hydrolase [Steroidobacteraceae bacterium]
MDRRHFLYGVVALPSLVAATQASHRPGTATSITARGFRSSRKFVELSQGRRIAYVEKGRGPAALFLHGLPLNGYQWRGALARLADVRRCIAPDMMGAGTSDVPEGTDQSPEAQVAMLAAFLDALHANPIDLVGSDSGGCFAQLFAARHPRRVRSLLLTNCDAAPDSPPPALLPLIADAHAGIAAEKWIIPLLHDLTTARQGLGQAYTNPATLTPELLEVYLGPIAQSALRRKQYGQALIALERNVLQPIEPQLRQLDAPVRILWGTADTIFNQASADYLNHLFPRSRGIRRIEGAKLFWPEEFPEIIAQEARDLWG